MKISRYINRTNHTLSLSSPTGGIRLFRPGEFSYDSYYARFVGPDSLTKEDVEVDKLSSQEKVVLEKDLAFQKQREQFAHMLSNTFSKTGVDIGVVERVVIETSKEAKTPSIETKPVSQSENIEQKTKSTEQTKKEEKPSQKEQTADVASELLSAFKYEDGKFIFVVTNPNFETTSKRAFTRFINTNFPQYSEALRKFYELKSL